MGIKGLMKLIADHAPKAVKEMEMKALFGRKVAVDASMSLYQFLIAVRTGSEDTMLTNEAGEVTSHLQGLFYRTIRMSENGVKPVFVFDGKPPQLKAGELDLRREAKEEARQQAQDAKENELEQEDINKYNRRTVRVTKEHNAEAKQLLRLMGVPVVDAPGEAEAQCAALCRANLVYATATEDMDALTFATPKLLRNMTFSAARKLPITEVDLKQALIGLDMDQEQFIELCILLGCDYTDNIKGIGPAKAYQLIKTHGTIEEALKSLDKEKFKIPDNFLHKEAHKLFSHPDIADPAEVKLEWTEPDEEGLVDFLCKQKGFNEERVRASVKKLKKSMVGGTQKRLENFFGSGVVVSSSTAQRKAEEAKAAKKGGKKAAAGKAGAAAKGKAAAAASAGAKGAASSAKSSTSTSSSSASKATGSSSTNASTSTKKPEVKPTAPKQTPAAAAPKSPSKAEKASTDQPQAATKKVKRLALDSDDEDNAPAAVVAKEPTSSDDAPSAAAADESVANDESSDSPAAAASSNNADADTATAGDVEMTDAPAAESTKAATATADPSSPSKRKKADDTADGTTASSSSGDAETKEPKPKKVKKTPKEPELNEDGTPKEPKPKKARKKEPELNEDGTPKEPKPKTAKKEPELNPDGTPKEKKVRKKPDGDAKDKPKTPPKPKKRKFGRS